MFMHPNESNFQLFKLCQALIFSFVWKLANLHQHWRSEKSEFFLYNVLATQTRRKHIEFVMEMKCLVVKLRLLAAWNSVGDTRTNEILMLRSHLYFLFILTCWRLVDSFDLRNSHLYSSFVHFTVQIRFFFSFFSTVKLQTLFVLQMKNKHNKKR